VLEADIIEAYYYQQGAMQAALQYDKQLSAATALLGDSRRYTELLQPKDKKQQATH
jgi:hypothetical protein